MWYTRYGGDKNEEDSKDASTSMESIFHNGRGNSEDRNKEKELKMLSHPVIAGELNYMESNYQRKARKIIVETSDALF